MHIWLIFIFLGMVKIMFSTIAFALGKADLILLIIILVIIAGGVGIYFLIPVINRKQYKQMRDNLEKREAAFKSSALHHSTEAKPVENKED